MHYHYETKNTCPKAIEFDLDKDVVCNVKFLGGGCPGNLQAVPRLVEGMKVSEIHEKLAGILCGARGTSCADQLAKAVQEAYQESLQEV